jgi:hypothetical protein
VWSSVASLRLAPAILSTEICWAATCPCHRRLSWLCRHVGLAVSSCDGSAFEDKPYQAWRLMIDNRHSIGVRLTTAHL